MLSYFTRVYQLFYTDLSVILDEFIRINSRNLLIVAKFHLDLKTHCSKFFDPASDFRCWNSACDCGDLLGVNYSSLVQNFLQRDINHDLFSSQGKLHERFEQNSRGID